MKNVSNRLRVVHIPQVGHDFQFVVEVKNEIEAELIENVLAQQHLQLFENNIIPDYSNAIFVEMLDVDSKEWIDYWNDDGDVDWDEWKEIK